MAPSYPPTPLSSNISKINLKHRRMAKEIMISVPSGFKSALASRRNVEIITESATTKASLPTQSILVIHERNSTPKGANLVLEMF